MKLQFKSIEILKFGKTGKGIYLPKGANYTVNYLGRRSVISVLEYAEITKKLR